MKSRGKKDISYWILASLIILIFILGFLEWRNLEIPKARGENIPAAAEKIIVLNFDDGPRPAVLKNLLPLLEKYDIAATFFVIGSAIWPNAKLIEEMNENGHEIENHSWGHENLKKLLREKGADAVKIDVEKTDRTIWEITCRKPCFFRPPFWEITDEIEKIIIPAGYIIMKLEDPDINTMDYSDTEKNRPPEALIARVKKIISERETEGKFIHILVFHELPLTVEALKIIIPYFKETGYKFERLEGLGYWEREAAK